MPSPKHQLDLKYKTIAKIYNSDSFERFTDFYESIYQYMDFIEKQKYLQTIIENDRNDVFEKEQQVESNKSLSKWDRRDTLEKIDKYSISSYYDRVRTDVYIPMKDYRELLDPVTKEHARGYALSNRQFIPFYFHFLDVIIFSIFRNIKERNYAYFRIRYKIKMLGYIEFVKKIHNLLTDKLLDIKPIQKTSAFQNPPEFNVEKSILTINGKAVNITLKNDRPNEHYILEYIFENGLAEKSYYSEIIDSKFPMENKDENSMRRSCEALNTKVMKQAGLSNFLVIKTGKGGYTQINSRYL